MLRSSSPSGFSWTSRAQETLAIEKIRQCSLFRRESRLNPLPASLARERTTLKNPSGEFLRAATRLDMARCRTGHRSANPKGLSTGDTDARIGRLIEWIDTDKQLTRSERRKNSGLPRWADVARRWPPARNEPTNRPAADGGWPGARGSGGG